MGDMAECGREFIAAAIGRSRQFVDHWVGRYRKKGLTALYPEKQPGAACKLTVEEQQELLSWLERGPTPEENLAAYNGPILREKIHRHFGKLYALNGLYDLLHRLNYNDLMPRTTHPDTDPEVLESFKKKNSPRPWKRSGKPTPASGS
jgi:transposase